MSPLLFLYTKTRENYTLLYRIKPHIFLKGVFIMRTDSIFMEKVEEFEHYMAKACVAREGNFTDDEVDAIDETIKFLTTIKKFIRHGSDEDMKRMKDLWFETIKERA